MNRALGLQEHVFWLLDRIQPMNVVGVAQVAGTVDAEALERSLAAAARAEPLLRAAFSAGAAPRLVSATAPVPLRVRPRADGDHWRAVAEDELVRRFADGVPLARVVLLRGAERCDLLCVVHHAIGDGFSALLLLRTLLAGLDPAARPPRPAPERPVLESLLPAGALPDGVSPTAAGAPVDLDAAVPPRWRPRLLQLRLDADETAALAARARAEETTVNGALCAAFLLAVAARAGGGEVPLACTCPVNVRGRLSPPVDDAFGLFVSEATTSHRLRGDEPFWEVARAARRELDTAIASGRIFRDQARLNAALAAGARLGSLSAQMDRYAPSQLGLTNLGRLGFAAEHGALRVEAMHFVSMPPVAQPLLSVTTFGGVMTANLAYPEPYLAPHEAAALTADLAARLRSATSEPAVSKLATLAVLATSATSTASVGSTGPTASTELATLTTSATTYTELAGSTGSTASTESADLAILTTFTELVGSTGSTASTESTEWTGSAASAGSTEPAASNEWTVSTGPTASTESTASAVSAGSTGAVVSTEPNATRGVGGSNGHASIEVPVMDVDALAARMGGLSDAKRRLLALRLAQAGEAAPEPEWEDVSLSHAQRAMWFLHQVAPESMAYTQPFAARIRGGVDEAALRRALDALTGRHATLRTTFPAPDGRPVQRVHRRAAAPLEVVDAAGWSDAQLDRRLMDEYARPFDPAAAPPWRAWLFRRSGDEHVLFLTLHHLVYDFWSLVVLVEELRALYAAGRDGRPAALAPAARQYADFVRAEAELLASPAGERMRAYWERQVAGVPPLDLPADRPRPPVQSFRGATLRFSLGAERTWRLRELAGARGATLFAALVALAQAFLHRWSGQERFLVGSPTAGRGRPELARVVGDFVNPVALLADFGGDPTFDAHLERARTVVLGALQHADYPLALLVERLHPVRDPARPPLFSAMVVLQNQVPWAERSLGAREADALPLEHYEVPLQGAQMDLTLEFGERGAALETSLKYAADLFDADTAGRMRDGLLALLDAALDDPGRRVSTLPLLDDAGRRRVVDGFNPAPWDEAATTPLALFHASADRAPDAAAVSCGGARLTYAALAGRASAVARALRGRGVRRGDVVGVAVERSAEMVAALLGVWQAGAAYLPLDPAFPPERLRFMAEDSSARLVLSDARTAPAVRPLAAALLELEDVRGAEGIGIAPADGRAARGIGVDREMRIDPADAGPAGQGIDRADEGPPGPEDLAYVLYTSGSTGRPKGVEVHHGAVASFLRAMGRAVPQAPGDVLAALTTLSFDISVLELLGPLTAGARVEVVSREDAVDAAALARRLRESGATLAQATPSSWRMLLDAGWTPPPGFRVLSGGEALPADLAARLAEGGGLWNLYGPTEATVWSTAARIDTDAAPVPIGRPLANTRAYVLDARGAPVPAGVPGELWLGGAGVARGYRGRPGLTAERFAPDPFSPAPGARMYATGDRARFRPDGALEYLGRLDQQLKLRGVRIEPGEIEAALRRHPAVRDAAAAVRGDAADARLVAYVVAEGAAPAPAELRAHLRAWLPEAMLPAAFVPLDALPRTANGKLDRGALPALPRATEEGEAAQAPPRGEGERRLAAIWREVLGCGPVGVHQNFFDLGGHSLLLARVQARVREELGVEIPVVELLRHPTVAALAARLERGATAEAESGTMDRVQERARMQLAARGRPPALPGRAR